MRQVYKNAKIRPKAKYILDDDISVMGMAAQGEGIALMPEMMLATASFDLAAVPLDPPQHRTVGIATLPIKETTLLVRTFVDYCKSYDFNIASSR
jgi:DNA-binding transcriptional LysR family regulator